MSRSMRLVIFPVVMLTVIAVVIFAVKTLYYSPWETIAEDSPWTAPNIQATYLSRTIRLSFNEATPEESVWRDAQGKNHPLRSVINESAKYLADIGELQRWPEAGLSNGIQSYNPPYQLYVVSITPTVVIMVPGKDQSQSLRGSYTDYLRNTIQHGTSIPMQPNIEWYSPDLKIKPQPVPFDQAGRGIIPLGPNDMLVCVKHQQKWIIGRADALPVQ